MAWDRTGRRVSGLAVIEYILPVLLALFLFPEKAQAQNAGCALQAAAAPQRQILRCRDGLTIEAEAGAEYSLVDRNRDNQPDAVSLRSRAIFIDAPTRIGRQGFETLTPQAIAAVRGTQWAVDVAGGKTAVFVVTGRVSVRRSSGRTASVNLGPGEGVDVEPGTAPLVVRRWPAARASALLARFGR
ncbi:FecR domain-containing protein [Microvirga sp. VF16]|uniref:FecR domain-containing protein n=1 Tax=Microvirga sp. VF16 TaxID=2807101 RepID=UPI00193E35BF|nr:FecR domain-containing protein [Microvirga sp. VF16]QRM30925.1 FecR domain-containing protein [Microvirga sp. VF16]